MIGIRTLRSSRSKPRREKGPTYLDACLPPPPIASRDFATPPLPRLCYFNFRSVYRFPFVYLPAMRAPRWLRSHHFVNIVSRAKTRMSLCHAPPPPVFPPMKITRGPSEDGRRRMVESNRIEPNRIGWSYTPDIQSPCADPCSLVRWLLNRPTVPNELI